MAPIVDDRRRVLLFWEREAQRLAPESLAILDQLPPQSKKVLLRGRELGSFFHARLFEEMLRSIRYPDLKYARELVAGLNVAGPVRPSNVWPPETDPEKSLSLIHI